MAKTSIAQRRASSRMHYRREDSGIIEDDLWEDIDSGPDDHERPEQKNTTRSKKNGASDAKSNTNPIARPNAFLSQKSSIYARARRDAKEIVNSGTLLLEDVKLKLAELQSREVAFEKYYQDSRLPENALRDSSCRLKELYTPILQDLNKFRSTKIKNASQSLKEGAPRRREVLRNFSKSARTQFEQAKQDEKDASDAAALIKHFKSLLHS